MSSGPRLLRRYITSAWVISDYTIPEGWSVVTLYGKALFCPDCGSLWARDEATFDATGRSTCKPWTVITRPCPRHGIGTVIDWINGAPPLYVHPPILRHDFLQLSKESKYNPPSTYTHPPAAGYDL